MTGSKVRPNLLKNERHEIGDTGASSLVRREIYDGRPHTVVPAVLAVAGVLNNALVTAEELAKSVEAWNGRDVPILHPEDIEGGPLSVAASPRILERAVGRVFGAHMDGDRLKAELWLDEQKIDRLGYSEMLGRMRDGEIVELSTAYFSDDVLEAGSLNGTPYEFRHTNLRPDHLALLPNQVGACSVEDGCGAPRVNRRGLDLKVNEALETLRKALGFHGNGCNCEACSMTTIKEKRKQIAANLEALKLTSNAAFVAAADTALGLKANAGLGAKHLKMLEELDEKGLGMLEAMISAYKAHLGDDPEPEGNEGDDPEGNEDGGDKDPAGMKQHRSSKVTMTRGELSKLIANESVKHVEEALRRRDVTQKLQANSANPFSDEELRSLPIDTLERVEKSLRPADYSGQFGGGGVLRQNAATGDDKPLRVNRGLLERRKDDDKRAA